MASKPSPAEIWVMGQGSRGDCQPLLAICAGLQGAGFSVKLLSNEDHAAFAESLNVPFESMMWDNGAFVSGRSDSGLAFQEAMANDDTMGLLDEQRKHNEKHLAPYVIKFDALLASTKPDLILYALNMTSMAILAALKYHVPILPVNLQVAAFKNMGPPPGLPNLPCGCNQVYPTLIALIMWHKTLKHEGRICGRAIGFDPMEALGFGNWKKELTAHADVEHIYLTGVSPLYKAVFPPDTMPKAIKLIGQWILPADSPKYGATFGGHEAMPQLEPFLAAGEVVYIGWGSVICRSPGYMVTLAVGALMNANKRGVVLGGGAKLSQALLEETVGSNDADGLVAYAKKSVLFLDTAPHEWLFSRAACVVHHGGAGTTAASLRSGSPTVVTPMFGDQPLHAKWVNQLGAGIGTTQLSKLTAAEFGASLVRATTDEHMRKRSKEVASQMSSEDGIGTMVELIKKQLLEISEHPTGVAATGLYLPEHLRLKRASAVTGWVTE